MVTSVRLPDELERAVLDYAERHDVSKSTAMRMAMENGLAREELARDVSELEDRLTAMEDTLTDVASALEQLQSAVDAQSSTVASDAAGAVGEAATDADYPDPTGVPTIPGGPDTPLEPAGSASDGTTEQAGIAQWNDASEATPEEVTDGGQPTESPPTDRP